MAYAAWSVTFGEQPSAAKWNILGTNDVYFNTQIGSNFSSGTTSTVWWEELGRTTLSGAADTVSVASFGARKYLVAIINLVPSGVIQCNMTFNSDSANNYARRDSADGAADTTSTSAASISIGASASNILGVCHILNVSAREKMVDYRFVFLTTSGAGTAPSRQEGAGKWANTSAQITTMTLTNGGAGDYASGSSLVILGHD